MATEGTVELTDDSIRISGSYGPKQVPQVCRFFHGVLERQLKRPVINFKDCTSAFPNSMLPLIALAAKSRQGGLDPYAFLPDAPDAKRRFVNSNWAHYLTPDHYKQSDDYTEPHLAVKRYCNSEEHYAALHGIIDVVLKTLAAPRSSISSLEWVMSEIMDNVLNHSNSLEGGFVQLTLLPNTQKLAFCVADAGRGILSSLREAFPNLQSDRVAIEEAVKAGVTRNSDFGQGNGLSGSLALAIQTGGWFRIVSGQAEVLWRTDEPEAYHQGLQGAFPGTVVDVQLPYSADVDIAGILDGSTRSPATSPIPYIPTDFFDTRYLNEDGTAIVLQMRSETSGFGSRMTGAQMRTKALNLLSADVRLPLVVDWEGVQVIASSFADEFIGKLFVHLGPVEFNGRVRLANLSPVVRALVNRAIMQRTYQSMTRGT